MKKTVLLALLAFLGSILFADPFGLKMGMTLDEIAGKCIGGKEPEYLGGGALYKIEPIKKNNHFVKYTAYVHDDLGLFAIDVETKPEDIEECKKRLQLLSLMLGTIYGEGADGRMWIQSMSGALENEKLDCVALEMKSVDGEKGYCRLFYMFENFERAKGAFSPF